MTTLASERAKQAEPVARLDIPKEKRGDMDIFVLDDVAARKLGAGQHMLYAAPPADDIAWGIDWGRNGDQTAVSIIKKLPDGSIEVVATEYGPPADDEAVRLLKKLRSLDEILSKKTRDEIDAYLAKVGK